MESLAPVIGRGGLGALEPVGGERLHVFPPDVAHIRRHRLRVLEEGKLGNHLQVSLLGSLRDVLRR